MNPAHDQTLKQFAAEDGPEKRLTTWYAQGQSDALGDRLLMFDNTNSPSWEILRFKPSLALDTRFEAALRERVEILSGFQHGSFPIVRPIKRLGQEDGLAVVSTYSAGAPLSDALKRPRSVDFALRMIRQLVPALVAFQNCAPRISHGALTADRIVLSTEGRLMIREHMVGSALESLELTATRMWSEFGVLVPPADSPSVTLNQRCDVAQLALIAVSLMVGRRVGAEDYPENLASVLDEIARRQHSQTVTRYESLRRWLERALLPDRQPFESAQDAEAALAEMRDESVHNKPPPEPVPSLGPATVGLTTAVEETAAVGAAAVETTPVGTTAGQATIASTMVTPTAPPRDDPTPPMWSAARKLPAAIERPPRPRRPTASSRTLTIRDRALELWGRVPPPVIRAAAIGLCVVAVVEAVVIGRLLMTRSQSTALVETKAAENTATVPAPKAEASPFETAPTPAALAASAAVPPVVVTSAAVDARPSEPKPVPPLPAPAAVRTGGFRVNAPIEIHVLDGERVLGSSTGGPIMAPAGRREYDFVNSVIGYRVRIAVDVKAGQIISVAPPIGNGTLNINAEPWATVFIDGNSVGETPLGNLSVVPGEHEIVFRHPQLGEKRQRTIVRADSETRVSVNMQR